ncbi:adenosine monophosphate-protein transferase SoFic [Clostridium tepidiprofundi DSM 19306]|uniref:Adenosine monophosphate-protein transferase SoFic n=1 Tax=Clostridium tepidiprofundi DSM 19306 TaxID=1121338 RepID=A0A151B6P5_9CLOT|nr:Fic family protein [Clostridium tepidiprofundi]KYH35317.1 adenosine monophosphate-protein transferase SoFic [Clostridium tepidiprofundi DSM 19306]
MIKAFQPLKLPIDNLINIDEFIDELLEANKLVGIYQVLLNKSKINPELLLMPITLQEAIQSTRIEGTQVTLDDMLEYGVDENRRTDDIQEVLNYSEALRIGERLITRIPISTRLIKEMHKILLSGDVRGGNRNPGEFRAIQNFIGPQGCTIQTASYIPPEPQLVPEYMSNLEKYINEPTDKLHDLVRIAIIHAQFETIHPFLDGNGRIGRILIPLYLFDKGFINSPNFFISESLEKDKFKYYKLLNDIRIDVSDDNKSIELISQRWNTWIKFFMNAIINQANKNIKLIERIDELYNETINRSRSIINSNRLIDIVNVMFQNPIFNKKRVLEKVDIPSSTLGVYLNKLEENQIIYSDGKPRNRKYYFYDLINILRE